MPPPPLMTSSQQCIMAGLGFDFQPQMRRGLLSQALCLWPFI